MSYGYLIPRFHGSPWDDAGAGSRYSLDLEAPRLSLYCPHPAPERPWLIGSFTLDPDSTERIGSPYWSWDLVYPTGDGYRIRLDRQAPGPRSVQYLADDAVRDRAGESARLMGAHSAGDMAAAAQVMKAIEHADAVTRARVPLVCGICDQPRVFRLESLHAIISVFWKAGIREVQLQHFVARVDRAGRRA